VFFYSKLVSDFAVITGKPVRLIEHVMFRRKNAWKPVPYIKRVFIWDL